MTRMEEGRQVGGSSARRRGRIEGFDRATRAGKRRWYFRVRGANGRIIAQSEAYNTKRARDAGILALVAVCVGIGMGDR